MCADQEWTRRAEWTVGAEVTDEDIQGWVEAAIAEIAPEDRFVDTLDDAKQLFQEAALETLCAEVLAECACAYADGDGQAYPAGTCESIENWNLIGNYAGADLGPCVEVACDGGVEPDSDFVTGVCPTDENGNLHPGVANLHSQPCPV